MKKQFGFDFEKKILNSIFEMREEDIYEITDSEKKLNNKKSNDYNRIYTIIDNIPDTFEKTKKELKEKLEDYLDSLSSVQANENEKFYKAGFSDAFSLFIECISKK